MRNISERETVLSHCLLSVVRHLEIKQKERQNKMLANTSSHVSSCEAGKHVLYSLALQLKYKYQELSVELSLEFL